MKFMDETFEILEVLGSSDAVKNIPSRLVKGFFAFNHYLVCALIMWSITLSLPLLAQDRLASDELLRNSQQPEMYIFDDPIDLAKKLNSQLSPVLGNLTIRIV